VRFHLWVSSMWYVRMRTPHRGLQPSLTAAYPMHCCRSPRRPSWASTTATPSGRISGKGSRKWGRWRARRRASRP
jgi:hypothetical protein